MTKSSMKDRVTAMVRDVLGPPMRAAGFRRTGRVFWRDRPDVCHVAFVVMNRWGSSDASSFDVRLGVFWHRVEEILENPSVGKMPPPEYRCTFRIDLGCTISMPPKPSWKVSRDSDFGALGQEVWHDLHDYGFPWFEYRSDVKRALDWKRYTRHEGGGRYSMQELMSPHAQAVFKVLLGKQREAVEDLERLADGYPKDALKLARRLRLSICGAPRKRGDLAAM